MAASATIVEVDPLPWTACGTIGRRIAAAEIDRRGICKAGEETIACGAACVQQFEGHSLNAVSPIMGQSALMPPIAIGHPGAHGAEGACVQTVPARAG